MTWIDAPLLLVAGVAALVLVAGHLALRPEVRGGKLLSENASRAVGVTVLFVAFVVLELWRGHSWQVVIDGAVIVGACGAAVILLWRYYGDPRKVANGLTDHDRAQEIIKAAQEAAKQ